MASVDVDAPGGRRTNRSCHTRRGAPSRRCTGGRCCGEPASGSSSRPDDCGSSTWTSSSSGQPWSSLLSGALSCPVLALAVRPNGRNRGIDGNRRRDIVAGRPGRDVAGAPDGLRERSRWDQSKRARRGRPSVGRPAARRRRVGGGDRELVGGGTGAVVAAQRCQRQRQDDGLAHDRFQVDHVAVDRPQVAARSSGRSLNTSCDVGDGGPARHLEAPTAIARPRELARCPTR